MGIALQNTISRKACSAGTHVNEFTVSRSSGSNAVASVS